MAFEVASPFKFTLLLLTLLPLISSHLISPHSHEKKSSVVAFPNHLQGCHKGEKVEGLHKLKKYLHHFGYLSNVQIHSESHVDEFDEVLDSAIKTYQKNYNLNASGILDSKTLGQMVKPRCGVADVINGKTWMKSGEKKTRHNHRKNIFHTVSHFAFFDKTLKWPASKSHLTYGFLEGTPSKAIAPVARAFGTWAANTHFTFSQASKDQSPDIRVSFERGDHGDGEPFTGFGGLIAHAFAPTDGRLHFDADEPWAVGVVSSSYDIETTALHEIGHLLGLQHSSIEGAIMWPVINAESTKGLHADDIAGIKALYNIPQ